MDNKSEKIRNYSITLLCVVATFFLIFYAIYLNNKIKAQQDLLTKVYDDYKFEIDEKRELQLSIKEKTENVGHVFNGMITMFSARLMESEDMISKSDADLLVIDSISKIKQTNPTLAELISIFNRNFINKRWKLKKY